MHSLWIFFLKKRAFTYLLMFSLTIAGIYALVSIPKESSPEVVVPIGIVLIQAYYAGFGNLDYFMDRHYSVKDSIAFVNRNKGVALGNGLGFLALLAIPIIGVFLAPTLGVAAATLSGIDCKNDSKSRD